MTVCSRCVLDTTVASISFDDDGVCTLCHAFTARRSLGLLDPTARARELARVVSEIKSAGNNSPYDCVIGVSGGLDSSYAALVAVRNGLRPLAVHVDNGWNSDLAVQNIDAIVRGLRLPLVSHVVAWEEFRGLQLSLLRAGVVDLELVSDHAIIAGMYQAARRHRIRYIVTGDDSATEATLPAGWNHRKTDLRNIRAINSRYERVTMRTFPQLSTLSMALHNRLLGLRYVGLLSYVEYRKDAAVEQLERELGWRRYEGKHFESIITRFYQGYILPTKFNIDKRRFHYSLLIHSGQMTREEALAEIKRPPYDPKLAQADLAYVCERFGISTAEFNQLMREPPRSHYDYPSDESVVRALLGALRGIRRVRERLAM